MRSKLPIPGGSWSVLLLALTCGPDRSAVPTDAPPPILAAAVSPSPATPVSAPAPARARDPFEHVALVLATHHHADHFDAHAALRLLASRPAVELVTTAQAAERMREADPEAFAANRVRIHGLRPAEDAAVERAFGSITGGYFGEAGTYGGLLRVLREEPSPSLVFEQPGSSAAVTPSPTGERHDGS